MLLAWPETADMYLSQRLALVSIGNADTSVITFSPTMALAEVLERIAANVFVKVRRRRIRLTLSATMAPPFTYRVPPEVSRWTEKREIARSAAARTLATTPELVQCQQDLRNRDLAAAVSCSLLLQVQAWAKSHGAQIVSAKPLWAVATQCLASKKSFNDGVVVVEPDGACLVIGQLRSTSLPVVHVVEESETGIEANIAALLSEVGIEVDRVLQLGFGAELRPKTIGYPSYLPRHWYQR